MGVCIRTGAVLILDLPLYFWKQIAGQNVTLDDFFNIETTLINSLKKITEMSEVEFQNEGGDDRFWTVTLADGEIVDLIPNGSEINVKYEDRFKYIKMIFEARLRESKAQF